jgi:rubrerythrin
MMWETFYDGWFEFYVCRFCGYKLQLTIDNKPLPDECPYCHAKNTTDEENEKKL